MAIRILVAIALIAGACGKDDKAGGDKAADKGPDPKAELAAFEKDVLPKLPKAAGIEWEAKLVDKDRLVMAVPKGWEAAKHFPGMYKAPSALGFGTQINAGVTCSGTCEPKDWKKAADKRQKQYRDRKDTFEVVEDTKLENPSGQLLVAKVKSGGPKLYISMATWKEGAARYYVCDATLNTEKGVALKDAVIAACKANVALVLK